MISISGPLLARWPVASWPAFINHIWRSRSGFKATGAASPAGPADQNPVSDSMGQTFQRQPRKLLLDPSARARSTVTGVARARAEGPQVLAVAQRPGSGHW